ncbi:MULTISPECIES: hypothetical protein [unclassified Pseudarthrobacter]|uniref:hypothetical protein n=1 Tax=unclassified Pseudarthrobacter TaxID=2647000 RepID=UPI0016251D69|nr:MULTISPECIES: hypothetical protein [unclassified Pseudarthrobacter]MBE4720317.1 hypothetical protein [Pseudarthrobacter sp. AB1]QNE14577.1 hypothetical protein FYJ92_09190 [Pseudarthrobacter sp. NBSH8]
MPYYVEYTIKQTAGIRSAVDGASLGEALVSAGAALAEAGARSAVIRFSAVASSEFGSGSVLARYSQTAGWSDGG